MWRFIKRFVGHTAAFAVTLQTFGYLFGLEEEVKSILHDNTVLVIVLLLGYGFLQWVVFDSQQKVQKKKYKDTLRGASLRISRPKKRKKK